MGDGDERRPIAVELCKEQIENTTLVRGIEITRCLIRQQNLGLREQSPTDRHTLTLALGERTNRAM